MNSGKTGGSYELRDGHRVRVEDVDTVDTMKTAPSDAEQTSGEERTRRKLRKE